MRHHVRRATVLAVAVLAGLLVLPAPALARDPGDPTGMLTVADRVGRLVHISGRANDPDATGPVTVAIIMDDQLVTYTGSDETGTFDLTIATSFVVGFHVVCAKAVNQGTGQDQSLGCGAYYVPPPVGTPQVSFRAVSTSEIAVDWATADENADGFRIERTFDGAWSTVTTMQWYERSWTQTGLTAGQPVCVNVVAFNDFSEQGTAVCGTSLKAPLPIVAPNRVDISVTETTATVRWTDASDVTGYEVQAREVRFTGGKITSTFVDKAGEGPYEVTLTGLIPGGAYWFYVRPIDPQYPPNTDWGLSDGYREVPHFPQILSVTVPPTASCAPRRQIVAQTQYATRVEIRRDGEVVANGGVYDLPPGDTGTYQVVATNSVGTAVTSEISVERDTEATLVKAVKVTNPSHDRALYIYVDSGADNNTPLALTWLPPGTWDIVPIPHGMLGTVVAKFRDSDEVVYSTNGKIMGHCAGATIQLG
jgi:Fibronectin type III domain